jgi:hypothetical protein
MEPKQFNDCFDDHLFRTGAMSYEETLDITHELNDVGFLGLALGDNSQRYWSDFCVFDPSVGTEYCVDWLDLNYDRRYPYAIRLAGDSSVVVHTADTCYSPFRENDLEPIHKFLHEDEDSEWGAIRQAQGRRAYREWLASMFR